MASSTPSNVPTRQQLEEIDALLRRMLTLPPLSGDAAGPAPMSQPAPLHSTPAVRETTPAPGDAVVQSWRAGWPAAQQPEAPPPPVSAWGSPVNAPMELPPWATIGSPATAPPFATPVAHLPASLPSAGSPSANASSGAQSGSLAVALLSLLSGTLDLVTYLLGPLGAWMRGPGRGVMGWVGVGMILAAIVWAVGAWYGYAWPRLDLARFGLTR